MISIPSSPSTPSKPPLAPVTPRWQLALLWAGVPLCALGFFQYRLWEHWHSGRFGELLVLAALSALLAWPLRRFARWSWAAALALPWSLALVLFADPLPVAATLVLAVSALALGGLLLGQEPLPLQLVAGLVLLGGSLAWLLPLPVHYVWSYLGLAIVLAALARNRIGPSLRNARSLWRDAVAAHPRAAALAVLALGLASTGCWLPTLQVDDLGYHLRLPWELLQDGRYAMDAETHIWALAPWLGDVVQAFPQVIGGAEARGPVNALWILLTAAGVWRLAAELGGDARARWASVALYASLPLTAVLAGSMQTETPTAALLVWLVALIARAPMQGSRGLYAGAVLLGGLLGLKLAAAAMAIVLLPWALWRHRAALRPSAALLAGALSLAVGTSSYVYAAVLTGNPFLPLFNAWFRSPYFAMADFDDTRWHAGFDAWLPWHLTFDTGRYLEAFAGGGGFVLMVLAGAWILALVQRRTSAIAAALALSLIVPLIPMQYLRYVFPACVALLPLLAVTAARVDPRRAGWMLAGLCVLNLVFQANGHWMLRTGAIKETVLALGDDAASFRHYAPERILLARMRLASPGTGNVLALDAEVPHAAETGVRARTISRYDPSLAAAAALADRDATGAAWQSLFERERIGEVLLRKDTLNPAQRAGLQRAGAVMRGEQGPAQWWSIATKGQRP
ncbi:glycosyltransferase family 39 protein [Pseudoxanthomonas sacheonensis]|uniref:glycosyltransferase family 39 protein n=1 Tax=Pseudoxanthomonas sacheonensis TaxID=443615 RepID=UPI0013D714CE|nr:glycosyltransferase family 39 protein [Pseudoxanthomonas sacheonensis]